MKLIRLLFATVLMLFVSVAYADPAIIITDFGCTMLDGNGGFFGTTDTKVVNSNNGKGGQINFACYANGVPNDQGRAVHWDYDSTGLGCNTLFGSTTDWKAVIDTEGYGHLKCRIHVNNAP